MSERPTALRKCESYTFGPEIGERTYCGKPARLVYGPKGEYPLCDEHADIFDKHIRPIHEREETT